MKIIQKKKKKIEMHVHFDPFHATDLFWCPLKTSEKLKVFWCFQGVSKKISGMKWVKRPSNKLKNVNFNIENTKIKIGNLTKFKNLPIL